MSRHLIPTSVRESSYTQQVRIEGSTYRFDFLFNSRLGRWILGVALGSAQLCCGVVLTADRPLPVGLPGQLWCYNVNRQGRDPGLRDLGRRCALLYVDEADCA